MVLVNPFIFVIMRLFFLVLFSVVTLQHATSQNLFTKQYTLIEFTKAKAERTPDGGFYLYGGNELWGGMLAKVDSTGEMLWAKRYMKIWGNAPVFHDAVTDYDGNTVFAASAGYPNNGSLVKVDSIGNFIWNLEFDFPITCLTQTVDSGFAVAGSTHQAAPASVSLPFYMVNQSGAITTASNFSYIGFHSMFTFGISQVAGKFYVLAQWDGNDLASIVCLDGNGDVEWVKRFLPIRQTSGRSLKLLTLPNHNLVVCGQDSVDHTAIACFVIDTSGNVLWSKKYKGPVQTWLENASIEPDGGFSFFCTMFDTTGPGVESRNALLRTDANGDLFSAVNFPVDLPGAENWLGLNDDGTHSLVYSSEIFFNVDTPVQQFTFALLDSAFQSPCVPMDTVAFQQFENPFIPVDGYLNENTPIDTVTPTTTIMGRSFTTQTVCDSDWMQIEEYATENNLNVYPNPFTEKLQLRFVGFGNDALVQMRDVLGQELYRKQVSASGHPVFVTIDASALTPGIYVITLQAKGERLAKKVVKQ